jgi:preprotein translocase subunit SecF
MTTTGQSPESVDHGSVFHRLYTGTGAFDIVGHRKRWYIGFATVLLIAVLAIVLRGFNFGIEFEGGTQIQMPAAGQAGVISTQQAKESFAKAAGKGAESVTSVGTGSSASIQIRTADLNNVQAAKITDGLYNDLKPLGANGKPAKQAISQSEVSGTWGGEISQQALIALAVFLVLVSIFLVAYFERWMAVAAIVALLDDLVITAGVYALVGFEVTPATVIGLLTILGFSLYDTVVVFDKIKENTRGLLGLTRRTYPEAANLAVNQTLMRSINTSLIALLPVIGLLVVGLGLLGVGTLTDLALVQLIGMLCGAMSSIFLATPLLVDMKMREQPFLQHQEKVLARRQVLARKGATATGPEGTPADDDETLEAELRQERAMSAAAGVPSRTGKGPQNRKAKPSGKAGRPTGKRRR